MASFHERYPKSDRRKSGWGQSHRFCSGYYGSGLPLFADRCANRLGLQLSAITADLSAVRNDSEQYSKLDSKASDSYYQSLFKPKMGVELVIERCRLAITASAVQGSRLLERAVGVQKQDMHRTFPRLFLQCLQNTSPEPETANRSFI